MSRNLPLDANDEDLIQRGLRRPSLDSVLNPISETFTAVRSAYDNAATGITSIDNIWPVRAAEELSRLSAAERRQYLEQRGLVPPEGSLPADISVPGIDQLVENVAQVDNETLNAALSSVSSVTQRIDNLDDRINAAIGQGANQIPTDSYGQPLIGPTTSPSPITTQAPSRPTTQSIERGTTGGASTPYVYTPIDLYDDRYDFNTGQIIRKGVATGTKGGVGAEDRAGNTVPSTGISDVQSEVPSVPSSVGVNDTSTAQYDDAILRQARAAEAGGDDLDAFGGAGENVNSNLTNRNETGADTDARLGIDPRGSDQRSTPPPRTETSPPRAQQAPRDQIIASRRAANREIRLARGRGERLERRRNPDGTYYAAPSTGARDISNSQNLPQRVRDF